MSVLSNVKQCVMRILDLPAEETLDNETDLIDKGLDSIKAIDLVVAIEEQFEINIDEEDLFVDTLNTINKLVKVVEKYQNINEYQV